MHLIEEGALHLLQKTAHPFRRWVEATVWPFIALAALRMLAPFKSLHVAFSAVWTMLPALLHEAVFSPIVGGVQPAITATDKPTNVDEVCVGVVHCERYIFS